MRKPRMPVDRAIRRRDVLVGMATTAMLLAGAERKPAKAAPVRGGRLVIAATGGGAASDTLDPRVLSSIYHGNAAYLFGNCLTEIAEGNALVPELAESWEPTDGGKRWIFHLRRGVTFHNGKTMTAEDVVWSINLHRGPDSKSAARTLISDVSDVKADGPDTVVLTMATPNADVPWIISDFHFIILPAETTNFDAGIGTGAFVMRRFTPGERVDGERNPNYWKRGRGHVDAVTLLTIGDATARLNGLVTGELHMIERLDAKMVALTQRTPGIQVLRTSGGGHKPFCMLCDTPPFDNPDMRMAIKLAIDRPDFLERIFRGFGRIGNDHPLAETDPFYPKDIPQHGYDPDKARFHFKKSGYDGPLVLSTSEAAFAEAIDGASLFKEHAAKAGIEVTIQREPTDGYWTNVWRKKPFVVASWGGRPTADIMLSSAYKSDAQWNDTHWKNTDFDRLLLAARAELDTARRKELYRDCAVLIHDTGGAMIPIFNDFIDAARGNVKGFFPGNYSLSGMRAAERVWLED